MTRIGKDIFFQAYPMVDSSPKHRWIVCQKGKVRVIDNRALKKRFEKFATPTCLLFNLKKQLYTCRHNPDDKERLIQIAAAIGNKILNKKPSKLSLCYSAFFNFFSGYAWQSTYSVYQEILRFRSTPKPVINEEPPTINPVPALTIDIPQSPTAKKIVHFYDEHLPLKALEAFFQRWNVDQLVSFFVSLFNTESKPPDWVFLNIIRGINTCVITENKHLRLSVGLIKILNRKKWLFDYLNKMSSYHTSFEDELANAMINFIQLYIVSALYHPKDSAFYLNTLADAQVFYTVVVLKGIPGHVKPLKNSNIPKSLKDKLHAWGMGSSKKWVQRLT